MNIKSIGKHIIGDYTNFYGNEYLFGNFVFNTMIESIEKNTKMKILHKKLEILNEDTPPGFTCILLLDESHFSAHAYTGSGKGMLAIDLFTCGDSKINAVIDYFNTKLFEFHPEVKLKFMDKIPRFITS
tara:strand:+ start:733 stop:1119 length:387 start_codon:yes stop_codon:yes gene_type:complete